VCGRPTVRFPTTSPMSVPGATSRAASTTEIGSAPQKYPQPFDRGSACRAQPTVQLRRYRTAERHGAKAACERRVVLCRPLLGIAPNPSTKDAEFVTFRLRVPPTMRHAARHRPAEHRGKGDVRLLRLDRPDGSQDGVYFLSAFSSGSRHEQQARHPIRSRPDFELVRGVAQGKGRQQAGLQGLATGVDRVVVRCQRQDARRPAR
jgi:hypothetical protein